MLSEPHKLFKLIWQKKIYCDYKSWTHFFLQSGSQWVLSIVWFPAFFKIYYFVF